MPQKNSPALATKAPQHSKKNYFFRLFIYLKNRFYVMGKN